MPEFKATGNLKQMMKPKFRTEAFTAEAEARIMMTAFENEIDSLLALLDSATRNKAVAESIIRRYTTAAELHEEMVEHMRTIDLKMMLVNDKMMGGFGGRHVLENTGETDQEIA